MPTTPDDLPDALREPLAVNVELLLHSRIPARLAWSAADGTPRVVPIWFRWTGEALVMCTFAGARKLADLGDGTIVAVTIDTDTFPYRSLKLRGPVTIRPEHGIGADYEAAAIRYLGAPTAARWLQFLDGADQVSISLRPTWAAVGDMADSPFLGASV